MTSPLITPVEGGQGSSATQIPNVDDGRSATMLEKMARAMWERNREACKRVEMNLEPWENAPEFLKIDWREIARAALQAIRELNHNLMEAHHYSFEYGYDSYYFGWQPTIDAILSEGAGE